MTEETTTTTPETTTEAEVIATLRKLHKARMEAARLNENLQHSKQAVMNAWALGYADELERQKQLAAEIADLEQAAKALAVAAYRLADNKHPYPGLNVKNMTETTYDRAKALEWAKEHNLCLTLDVSAWKDQVKAMVGKPDCPDWIKQTSGPVGTIAQDLGKALGILAYGDDEEGLPF